MPAISVWDLASQASPEHDFAQRALALMMFATVSELSAEPEESISITSTFPGAADLTL
jgi:hypothetical protein